MKSVLSIIAVLACVSCSPVGPDYKGAPGIGSGERFAGSSDSKESYVLDRWWRRLKSAQLNRLVDTALNNNYDLAIAQQRLQEARAMRTQTGAAFLPQGTGNLSLTRFDFGEGGGGLTGEIAKTGVIKDPLDYWSGGVDVSWEVDVFGGRRRAFTAAGARVDATREALHAVRLGIVSETVETFFSLAGLREQLRELNRQVESQEEQLRDMEEREAAGAASKLDLDRSRSRLEQTRAALPNLQAGVTKQLRRLALLMGASPSSLDNQRIAMRSLPRSLPMVRTGVPAELLMRRPDLRRAERELAAATADIGVATANFYPRFSLLGSPTAATSKVGDLFEPRSFDLQIGPQMSWSLFSGGRNRAILEAANTRQRAALYQYEKAVLAAVGEVETQLAALRAEQQRLAIVQRAREATSRAVTRVRDSRDAGAVDALDVLLEEQRLREVRILEIRIKSQMVLLWTGLHKALGGGWH